jgi:hypothetical protein
VDCDGNLSLGILGGAQLELGLRPDGVSLFAQPMGTPKKCGVPVVPVIQIAIFLKRLLHIRMDPGIDDPRCPVHAEPLSVARWGIVRQNPSGCGSQPFIFNMEPFESCCTIHDVCYSKPGKRKTPLKYCWRFTTDNCSATFLDCNSAFATCTYDRATEVFPDTDILSLVERLGYQRLASIFAYLVQSEIGLAVFDTVNQARCQCCKTGEVSCASGCANLLTDPNNCGGCVDGCHSGVCQVGVCLDQDLPFG